MTTPAVATQIQQSVPIEKSKKLSQLGVVKSVNWGHGSYNRRESICKIYKDRTIVFQHFSKAKITEHSLVHILEDFVTSLSSAAIILILVSGQEQQHFPLAHCIFLVKTQGKISHFKMRLTDVVGEELRIPEAEYQATVRMPLAGFARICKDLSTIGHTVVISVSGEGVKFSTRGAIGTAQIICRHNANVDMPEEATIIEMEEPVSLTFSLRNMNTFAKAIPSASQVAINMSSDDLPVVVEYRVAEMGYIGFYLAPKVQEENEARNEETDTESEVTDAESAVADTESEETDAENEETDAENEETDPESEVTDTESEAEKWWMSRFF